MSVNVLSLKLLIFWGHSFYISYCRKACHFTWSSKPCKGLAVCKAKVVPSMFSHFKAVRIDQTHNLPTELYCSRKFRAILLSYLNEVLVQLNTYLYTNNHSERFLHYVIKYAWFYKLMCDAAFNGCWESCHEGVKSDLVIILTLLPPSKEYSQSWSDGHLLSYVWEADPPPQRGLFCRKYIF